MHQSTLPLLALFGAICVVESACVGPLVNQATIDLIKSFEGWEPDIYPDPVGLPTVGYGHLCKGSRCSDVPYPIPLSEADGEKLLQSDLVIAQNCMTQQTAEAVFLNANQYGALVSWAFNVGCGQTLTSSLIQRLNEGIEDPNVIAAFELPRWKYAGGVVLRGLERRRAAEVVLFKTPSDAPALPANTC
ncbi:lysozyme-like domain-containing protein [Immersiella caudata]|uniref:Lysozyme-like domain-containing protein n=1 Tax=Immersiella caudata TaxID=314043 RepID=A0AA39WW10_9PEZI|nr:lysozyme-like domain-containing protein [Immersiella caudata]